MAFNIGMTGRAAEVHTGQHNFTKDHGESQRLGFGPFTLFIAPFREAS